MIRSQLTMSISILVIVLFTLSMLVPVHYLPFDTSHDKIKHTVFFVLITLSIAACLRQPVWKIALSVSLFALVSEVAQHFLPYRSGSVDDLVADLIGVVIGCVLIKIFQIIYSRLKSSDR